MKPDSRTTSDSSTEQSEAASKKKKLVLVFVLSIGLLIAIVTQPEKASRDDNPNATTATPASVPAIKAEPTVNPGQSDDDRLVKIRALTRMDLNTITELELFAPEPRRMRRRALGDDVRRVDAIYVSPDGHAALLGEAIVRGGQSLPDGRTVLKVTGEGIEISH